MSSFLYVGYGLSVLLEDIECAGTERSIVNCSNVNWGSVSPECSHDKDAGVVCTDGKFS